MISSPTLSGRRMVITGAGRGLGRALAIVAADLGAELVLLGRNQTALELVADAIEARTGRRAVCLPCDLGNPGSIAEACRHTLATGAAVDVLVNNGAPWLPGKLEDLADQEIAATVAAAVTGTALVTKALLPGLQRSAAADIVTIVSTGGLPGQSKNDSASAVFRAAKHAQSGFSGQLHEELKKYGIRVSAIYPPDFEDLDPLSEGWNEVRDPGVGAKLTNREVIGSLLFAIGAPRVCSYPVIVLDHMFPE